VRAPLLAGVLRPVLVLPAVPCPQAHLHLIFAHELIHLQRRDVLRQLLVTAAGILYWYHPAVWLLQAAARRDAEQATDAAVLALPTDGKPAAQHSAAYGEALLHSMARARSLPLATGFSAPKKELKERMKHLFDTRPGRRGRALTALVLCVTLLCALAAGCAANTLQVEQKPTAPLTMAEDTEKTTDALLQQAVKETPESTGEPETVMNADITWEMPLPEDMPALQWPVPDSRYVSKTFTGLQEHNGLDIAAAPGSSIVAAADGTVAKAYHGTEGYGTYVLLEHDNGVSTIYSHCRELLVTVGDTVKAGESIARVGSSGKASFSHCHFELRIQGTQINPQRVMRLSSPVLPVTGTQDGWLWPVPDFAYCSRAFTGAKEHAGLDICGAYDTPIYAAAAGTVLAAEETSVGDGVYVVLDHGSGITSKYAHCSTLAVQAGDTVTAGQLIAYMGSTGNSTGNHCHLEICEDGVPVDPAGYVGTLTG
jgi:murein DD-endopeptidase MepM/ murein hydrolase activator NlpD